jgi:DNA polymerase III sliding clamp (beta) subunit (PCNA family)
MKFTFADSSNPAIITEIDGARAVFVLMPMRI